MSNTFRMKTSRSGLQRSLSVQSLLCLRFKLTSLHTDERGDVPGWVLITLMTAGLVIIIWAVAGPALSGVFQQAIDRVTGF